MSRASARGLQLAAAADVLWLIAPTPNRPVTRGQREE
jgi:hypothetical protein